MRKINLTIPIFNINLKVRIGDLNKIIDKYNVNIIPPAYAFHFSTEDYQLIALPDDWTKYVNHEAGHCAWEICRIIGQPPEDSEELILYLQDYIVNEITKWIT